MLGVKWDREKRERRDFKQANVARGAEDGSI